MADDRAQPEPVPATFTLVSDAQVDASNADLWEKTERWDSDEGTVFRTILYGRTALTQTSPAVALVYVPKKAKPTAQPTAKKGR